MKEFRAAADIEVPLLFDSAKLKSSSSEGVSVQGADLGIVGKGPAEADLRMREIHLAIRLCRLFGFFSMWRTISDPTNSRTIAQYGLPPSYKY